MYLLKIIGNFFLAIAIATVDVTYGDTECYHCDDVLQPDFCQQTASCDEDQMCFTHFGPYGAAHEFRYSLGCTSKLVCDTLDNIDFKQHLSKVCSECCSTTKCNIHLCTNATKSTVSTSGNTTASTRTTVSTSGNTSACTRTTVTPTARNTTTNLTTISQPINVSTATVTTSSQPITVSMVKPTVTMQKLLDVLLGSIVRLNCTVTGYPAPSVQWLFNGSPHLSANTNIQGIGSVFYLTINSVSNSDAGRYSCYANNTAGSSISHTSVNVSGEPPRIKHAPHSLTVKNGQRFTLTCHASGIPEPSIKWTYNIKHNSSYAKYLITHSRDHNHLTIHFASAASAGNYTCTATNKFGTVSASATITVLQSTPSTFATTTTKMTTTNILSTAAHEKPIINLTPHHMVGYGGSITLHCNATGTPPLIFTWRQIPGDFPANVHQSGEDLIITHAQPYSHRLYQCRVKNAFGTASGLLALTIKETKPVIFESPLSQTIYEGSSASFTCNGTGYPLPSITWTWISMSDGNSVYFMDLLKSNHISASSDNTTLRLIQATVSFSGHLKCTCSNSIGQVTVDAQVIVLPSKAPHIASSDEFFSTSHGSDIVIPCNATGEPKPSIEWKFNEGPISANNVKEDNMSLVINGATPNNIGTYKCVASNIAGQDVANFIVSVVGRGPSFTTAPPSSIQVIYGHSHVFTCTANGIPTPTISWSYTSVHGSKTFPAGSHMNNDHSQMTVPINDFGVIICIAENAYGRTTSQTSIYVKTAGLIG